MSDAPHDPTERWIARFEQEGVVGKAALVSGTVVRFTANLIDKALDQAATTVAEAEVALRRELDPNIQDAKILDEWDEQ